MKMFFHFSLIFTAFSFSSLGVAGTTLSKNSQMNKSSGGFVQISATNVRQGIYGQPAPGIQNYVFSELGRRALQAGFPVRYEKRDTMGYAPYTATIVTIAKTQDHLVELDMNSDLGFNATLIVTSLHAKAAEITMQIDASAAASISFDGPLVPALKSVLVKLKSKETLQGVLSLNGSTQTIYDLLNHAGKNDLACGPLAVPNREQCVVYLN